MQGSELLTLNSGFGVLGLEFFVCGLPRLLAVCLKALQDIHGTSIASRAVSQASGLSGLSDSTSKCP